VFDAPVVGQIASAMGGIRVDRGTGSSDTAAGRRRRAGGGEVVAIMPEGTIHEVRRSSASRQGVGARRRLAQMTGAPVIPIGLWGTEKVWPRSSRLPNVLNVSNPTDGYAVRVASRSRWPASRSTPTRSAS
jgi:putative phosphoserine phosphatase/1-acylglycerol-3-phosphate O-acyltransferase